MLQSILYEHRLRHLILVAWVGMCAETLGGEQEGSVNSRPDSSAAARTNYEVEITKDLPYLEAGRDEKLDLYRPRGAAASERFPGIVIVHGGGWRSGDKGAQREINLGTTLAGAGFVCVSINYRLQVAGQPPAWPQNILDCKNAVRFLRAHADEYQVNPERIGAIGGSAGGHLVSMMGVCGPEVGLEPDQPYPGISSRVQAVVDLYGITNLLTRQKVASDGAPTGTLTGNGSMAEVFGATIEENRKLWEFASPVTHVTADDPPFLILHGLRDATVDYPQSEELARKLAEIGVPHQIELIDGVGHTFHLDAWGKKPMPPHIKPLVIGFFERYLRAAP